MAKHQVVVEGGGSNLYEISEYDGYFYARKVNVGFISDTRIDIGKARSFDHALSLIKSHSGRRIKSID